MIVPAHNAANSIRDCLNSVLANSFSDFEILVVDDGSTDRTREVVNSFDDRRIRILHHRRRRGAGYARNRALKQARGKYTVFLDADCVTERDWLATAFETLEQADCVAVEGSVLYRKSLRTIRDEIPLNPFYNLNSETTLNAPGQDYAACNIAYRTEVLRTLGGFATEMFRYGREDTDLGTRAAQIGKVVYNGGMQVTHLSRRWTLRALLQNALRYRSDVTYVKQHRDFVFRSGTILHPELLRLLIFPPLLIIRFRPWLQTPRDWAFLPKLYFYLLAVRLNIWRAALRERVLLF